MTIELTPLDHEPQSFPFAEHEGMKWLQTEHSDANNTRSKDPDKTHPCRMARASEQSI